MDSLRAPFELEMSSQERLQLRSLQQPSFSGQHDGSEEYVSSCRNHIPQNNSANDFHPWNASQDRLIRSKKVKLAVNQTPISTSMLRSTNSFRHNKPLDTENVSLVWLLGHLWFKEILACLLGAAAISGVVATLCLHQGRPLPEWPFKISINTLISVFSMVLKASITFVIDSCIGQLQWLWFRNSRSLYDAVRYDEASRGPWGSAKLLASHSISRPVTSFAAIASILSVAVDPFFQQILRYDDCQVPMLGVNSTVLRTSYFDKAHISQGMSDIFLSQEAQTALNMGALAAPGVVPSYCPTGNCTFPMFSTIGLCSSCEDISQTLVTSATCFQDMPDMCEKGGFNYTSTLPSGLSVEWGMIPPHTPTTFISNTATNMFGFELIASRTYFSDIHHDPATGTNLTGCTDAPSTDWRCRGYGAASCTLYPCVKTFNTSIVAGETSELLVAQTDISDVKNHLQSSDGFFWNPMVWVDSSCLTWDETEAIKGRINYTNGTWLIYNSTNGMEDSIKKGANISQVLQIPDSIFAKQCVYVCDGDLLISLSHFITQSNLMIGNVTADLNYFDDMDETLDTMKISQIYGQNQLQLLYNAGNISFGLIRDTFHNIADTFTLYMRENGNINYTEPAYGIVYHYATCLDVNWAWISLPAALVLGAACVVTVTQIIVLREGVPVWRSSILPYMYRTHLDGGTSPNDTRNETGGEVAPSDALEVMEEKAKATRVILDQSTQSSKLVRV